MRVLSVAQAGGASTGFGGSGGTRHARSRDVACRTASSLALKRASPAAKLCEAKLPRRGAAEGTRTDEDPRQCRHRA